MNLLLTSRQRFIAAGSSALAVAAGAFFLVPGQSAFLPPCVFHSVTGLYCPGCGITRALHALAHGDVVAAIHNNVLFFVLAATIGTLLLTKRQLNQTAIFGLVGFVFAFTVMRNLPWAPFDWIAPIPV